VFYKENEAQIKKTQKHLYEAHTGKVGNDEDMGLADLDDIDESLDMPKDKAPTPFYFFQRALTTEWESLLGKEREAFEAKALIWRSLGPDEHERRR
jgi:hypothetical protein